LLNRRLMKRKEKTKINKKGKGKHILPKKARE
jgi:hypothetical protein